MRGTRNPLPRDGPVAPQISEAGVNGCAARPSYARQARLGGWSDASWLRWSRGMLEIRALQGSQHHAADARREIRAGLAPGPITGSESDHPCCRITPIE